MKVAVAALFSIVSLSAFAADEVFETEGKVAAVYVAQNGQDFKVSLETSPNLCGKVWTIAYLNAADRNYNAFVDTLLRAKAEGWTVTTVTELDQEGQCHLTYLIVK